jgi:CheY-like chemotaxis protein
MTERMTRTVLIVDGSATMLYYHGILLKRLNFSVLTADSPEDALKVLDQTNLSLILTALSFPSMSGVDFIKKIKSGGRTQAIPVIVLTADEHVSSRSACLKAGCTAYLNKPVDPGALHRTIQAAVETVPREHIRISTSLKTVIDDGPQGNAAEHIEYATMISEKGLYLRMLAPKSKDEVVPIRIYFKDREIKAKTIVLYKNSFERGVFKEPGIGLKFIDISAEDQRYIRNFIYAQLVSDIVVDPQEEPGGFAFDLKV